MPARLVNPDNPARYTGLWMQQQEQAYEDPDRFTVETPPDPAHAATADAPPEAVVMQRAPVLQGGGELVTDAIIEELYDRPPADPIDHTPAMGAGPEASNTPPGGFYRPSDTTATDQFMRGLDLGAVRRGVGQLGRPFRFPSEQWFGLRVEAEDAPPITAVGSDPILQRGVNAYPTNQGPGGRVRAALPGRTPAGRAGRGSWSGSGWRRGVYEPLVTNVQRHFKVPNRTHRRFRVVQPDVIAYVGDSPPPDRSDKYASPFSKLQRFGLNVARTRRPGMRRAPGPWDEAVVAAAPTISEGRSIDGLVVP